MRILAICGALILFSFHANVRAGMPEDVEGFVRNSWIFVFDESRVAEFEVAGTARGLMRAQGLRGKPDFVYSHTLRGFSARMSYAAAVKLAEDSDGAIVRVAKDGLVYAIAPPPGKGPDKDKDGGDGGTNTPPPQETPWGVTRVNGGVDCSFGCGRAWVLDTGIDLDHEDLTVETSLLNGAWTAFDREGLDDKNGHGTHVAGTIAAVDNDRGVIGVAAGATVIPVKVLNRRGSGTYSGVIAGIDHVAANGSSGDVANMSLGGGFSQAVNDAVEAAAERGILFSLAAGNESTDASTKSPASAEHENIYTVSATDRNDAFAYFSNYCNGPVDYAAPGVSILSTWKNGEYNTISGTSMAAPHVAGLLLLGSISEGGLATGDPDQNGKSCKNDGISEFADPIAVH